MKAKELNRNLPQYQELYGLDKDEFIYSIVYELAIRAAKDDIIEKMNLFQIIDNGKIDILEEELYKQLDPEIIEHIYYNECNEDGHKMNIFIIEQIKFKIYQEWKIDIVNSYWEYHFIPNETKEKLKIFESLHGNKNFVKKKIYNEWESRAYFEKDFIRVETDIIEDSEHKNTTYTYHANYKRPMLMPSAYDEGKRVSIEIDINLPKDALELQLKKLIKNIHHDNRNILNSFNNGLRTIGSEYKETFSNSFKQKGELVDMLLAYDYELLRRCEIDDENRINKEKKEKELQKVKNDTLLDKDSRKIRNDAIKDKYGKIYLNTIYDEISQKLNIQSETAKKHIIQINKLLKNKNYLKLINGIST